MNNTMNQKCDKCDIESAVLVQHANGYTARLCSFHATEESFECPRCDAPAGEPCRDVAKGNIHMERALRYAAAK